MAAAQKRTLWQWVALGWELALIVPAGLAIGYLVGYWLDRRFNTAPIFALVLSLLGVVGGMFQVFRLLARYERDTDNSGK